MKCKKCGYITRGKNALANMGKHYRKKHPYSMRVRRKARKILKQNAGVFTAREIKILKRIAKGF